MATDRGGLEALAERFAYLKPHLEIRVNGILAFTASNPDWKKGPSSGSSNVADDEAPLKDQTAHRGT